MTESEVVYGSDDRLDVYSFAADSVWKQRALSLTVALMRPGEVSVDAEGIASFNGARSAARGTCARTRASETSPRRRSAPEP